MRRGILFMFMALGLWLCLGGSRALAQDSHRRPTPPPPPQRSGGDVFDRVEREQQRAEREAARRKRQQERMARLDRREALQHLREDLPQLRSLLDQLNTELRETDVRTEFDVSLRQQADQLERLAKRIRKNIRKL